LFKGNDEEMMEFAVENDLGATRAMILMRQGKYGEAVLQYLDEEQSSEALDLTLEHIDDVMRDGDAFNAIVEKFFWQNLSFGCRGWPEYAGIPSDKILALLERTRGLKMNDRDQKLVREDPSCYLTRDPLILGTALYFQTYFARHEVENYPEDPIQPRPSLRKSETQ